MNALVQDSRPVGNGPGARDEQWLDWLMASIRTNRFIPAPPPENVFVGDGDFRTIGAEFLGHLVRIAGLKPDDRVLDIGSGIGRLAGPLTQLLDRNGSYLGLDPAREGIEWCQKAISSVYPAFRFRHIDVAHPLYNADGLLRGNSLVLPVGDRSIDLAVMISVVTHLPPDETSNYCGELARVLAPGGRCFISLFSIEPEGPPVTVTDPRCTFSRMGDSPAWSASATDPLGMIAYDAGWLEHQLTQVGLNVDALRPGSWRGITASHYQDVLVASLPEGAA
jgi:SAM-dependent methyltransferase